MAVLFLRAPVFCPGRRKNTRHPKVDEMASPASKSSYHISKHILATPFSSRLIVLHSHSLASSSEHRSLISVVAKYFLNEFMRSNAHNFA